MERTISGGLRLRHALLTLAAVVALAAPAAAQTLTLTDAADTTLRGGSYANRNFGNDALLVSRASSDPEYVRRPLLKFDTHNTIPAGSAIASATLTVTVRGGNPQTRTISLRHVPVSYDESQATWNIRRSGTAWSSPGGQCGTRYDTESVTNVPGSRVTFNVTSLVQDVVNGRYGSSRYARMILVDEGSSSRDSYKEYHSEAAGAGLGPVLVVVLGSGSVPPPPPPPDGTSTTTLKVLHWNTHHGGIGTDGVYDLERVVNWIVRMNPQVISLNEIEKYTGFGNEDQPRRYRDLLESKTGKRWYLLVANEYGNWTSNGKCNVILSQFPFVSTALEEISWDRSIALATFTVNGRNITFMSTHLDHESRDRRYVQAGEVIAWARNFPENRIIAGDFNAWPDQTSIARMTGSYYDGWVKADAIGQAYGYSPGAEDGQTRNGRIDYVFYSKTASNLVIRRAQVVDTRDSSGDMPSDHRPLLVTFEVR